MARSRKLSSDIIHDEEFNSLSIAGQLLFLRMLAQSDDCGVVPLSEHAFQSIVAPPKSLKWTEAVDEIIRQGLGSRVIHKGKPFFLFKQESFQRHQSYIFNKRKESQYLHISAKEFDEINWSSIDDHMTTNCGASGGIRYKDKGIRNKEEKKVESAHFETLWANYPRREGKKEALRHYLATVKPEDQPRIEKALANYKAHLKRNQTEDKYVKMGSTWFNNWPDWEVVDKPATIQTVKKVRHCENCGGNHQSFLCPRFEVNTDSPAAKDALEKIRALSGTSL